MLSHTRSPKSVFSSTLFDITASTALECNYKNFFRKAAPIKSVCWKAPIQSACTASR